MMVDSSLVLYILNCLDFHRQSVHGFYVKKITQKPQKSSKKIRPQCMTRYKLFKFDQDALSLCCF